MDGLPICPACGADKTRRYTDDGHWLICFRGCGNVWEPGTNRAFPWHF